MRDQILLFGELNSSCRLRSHFQNKPQLESNETKPKFSKRDNDAMNSVLNDSMCGGWTCIGGLLDGRDDEIVAEIKEDDKTKNEKSNKHFRKLVPRLMPRAFSFQNKPQLESNETKSEFSKRDNDAMNSSLTPNDIMCGGRTCVGGRLDWRDDEIAAETKEDETTKTEKSNKKIAAETKEDETTKTKKSNKHFRKSVGLRQRRRKPTETKNTETFF
jgi:hypothetical protein